LCIHNAPHASHTNLLTQAITPHFDKRIDISRVMCIAHITHIAAL